MGRRTWKNPQDGSKAGRPRCQAGWKAVQSLRQHRQRPDGDRPDRIPSNQIRATVVADLSSGPSLQRLFWIGWSPAMRTADGADGACECCVQPDDPISGVAFAAQANLDPMARKGVSARRNRSATARGLLGLPGPLLETSSPARAASGPQDRRRSVWARRSRQASARGLLDQRVGAMPILPGPPGRSFCEHAQQRQALPALDGADGMSCFPRPMIRGA